MKCLVSSIGKIRNIKTGRILKLNSHPSGYLQVGLYNNTYEVHRLVAHTFIDNPDNKTEIDDIDQDKHNNFTKGL